MENKLFQKGDSAMINQMTIEGRTYRIEMYHDGVELAENWASRCGSDDKLYILNYQEQIPSELQHLIFTFPKGYPPGHNPETDLYFDGKKWKLGKPRDYFWYFHILIRLS